MSVPATVLISSRSFAISECRTLTVGTRPPTFTPAASPLTLILSLPSVPLTIDVVGRVVAGRAAERAGEVDVELLDVGSGQVVDGDDVGAAESVEVDPLDAVGVHGDVRDVAVEPEPVSVRRQVDLLGDVGAVEEHRVGAVLPLDRCRCHRPDPRRTCRRRYPSTPRRCLCSRRSSRRRSRRAASRFRYHRTGRRPRCRRSASPLRNLRPACRFHSRRRSSSGSCQRRRRCSHRSAPRRRRYRPRPRSRAISLRSKLNSAEPSSPKSTSTTPGLPAWSRTAILISPVRALDPEQPVLQRRRLQTAYFFNLQRLARRLCGRSIPRARQNTAGNGAATTATAKTISPTERAARELVCEKRFFIGLPFSVVDLLVCLETPVTGVYSRVVADGVDDRGVAARRR